MRMIKFRSIALLIVMATLGVNSSCSTEDAEPTPLPEPEEILDTHTFLVLRNDGRLFEIGGESGIVVPAGRVPGVVFNTNFNSLTYSSSNLYFYEQVFDPVQGYLYVLNRRESTSRRIALSFPEEVYGPVAGVFSLDWSESLGALIGLVKEYSDQEQGTFRLIVIDPQTFEVRNLGVVDNLQGIRSTALIGPALYVSSLSDVFEKGYRLQVLSLTDNSLTELDVPGSNLPPILLSGNSVDSRLFGFIRKEGSNLIQAAYPVRYSPDSQTYQELPLVPEVAVLNAYGKSYFDQARNQHVALVATPEYFALLKYNIISGSLTLTPLKNFGELSSLVGILDVKASL